MSHETFTRVEQRRRLNSNRQWVNHDVYRLRYKEDLYLVAYERIKSKPGNMTAGTDEETLDGFSLEAIRQIIQEMRTEQFRFKPVRTTFIPKAKGKMRKLGMPCVRDKVVQEVMHMILEAIYDSPHGPYFQETSHGFRPNRSCHTALREFRGKWTAVNWIVEGDIGACFDELDHHVLDLLPRDAQRVCSLQSNGHKTRPSWLSRVQEAQRAVAHATADDAVHGAFMTLPRYTYTREDACDARAAQVTGWQSPGLALSPEEWTERLQGAPLHNEMPS